MIQSAEHLAQTVGVVEACQALDISRSSLYRSRQPVVVEPEHANEPTRSLRALSQAEKATVRQVLDSERFQDQAPREVYATLIDEGLIMFHSDDVPHSG
jgi:putative transposase